MTDSKLLIVDDSPFIRMILRQLAEEAKWETILEAENGRRALELLQESPPTLVLLDVKMPTMDGLATLKAIRASNKEIRVVMLTSVNEKETIREAMKMGASEYIVKPFEHGTMLAQLVHWQK